MITQLNSAADLRQRGNTYKAMLEDTLELLEDIVAAQPPAYRVSVKTQIEAIKQLLTDGAKAD